MKTNNKKIHPLVERMITTAGETTQSFGFGRIIGQVYTLLYFSDEPLNLNQIQETLNISKGSASLTLNQLQNWKAIEKISVEHDRKEHFIAKHSLGHIIKKALADTAAKTLNKHTTMLEQIERDADALANSKKNHDHTDLPRIQERLAELRNFHDRVRRAWDNPLIKHLLK